MENSSHSTTKEKFCPLCGKTYYSSYECKFRVKTTTSKSRNKFLAKFLATEIIETTALLYLGFGIVAILSMLVLTPINFIVLGCTTTFEKPDHIIKPTKTDEFLEQCYQENKKEPSSPDYPEEPDYPDSEDADLIEFELDKDE